MRPLVALAAGLVVGVLAFGLVVAGWPAGGQQEPAEPSASATLNETEATELLAPRDLAAELERAAERRESIATALPELDASFREKHGERSPEELFELYADLRAKVSNETHEVALELFRAGEGVPFDRLAEPHDGPAAFFVEKEETKRLMRVGISARHDPDLWLQHAEVRWLEAELNSFRWDAKEMESLATTNFEPSGEARDIRHEFLAAQRRLSAFRARRDDPQAFEQRHQSFREYEREAPSPNRGVESPEPLSTRAWELDEESILVTRVATARSAYLARRRVTLAAPSLPADGGVSSER